MNEQKNQELSIWGKYFSGWNLLINGVIAFIPAVIVTVILLEMGFSSTLASALPIISFVYIAGLVRGKISKKNRLSVNNSDTPKSNSQQATIVNNKSSNKKRIWIGIGVIILLIIISAFSSSNIPGEDIVEKSTILQADQVSIPGFVEYSGEEAGFNFSVLFPIESPEIFDLDLEEVYIKSYQAPDIIDLEEKRFVQYSVFFSVLQEGKILSEESIKAYLEGYIKGKSVSGDGILIKEEMTTYKGLMAIEYVLNSEIQGTTMIHKGIAFIVDGVPIDLSVVYTNVTPISSIHYDSYIKSFALSKK